MSKHDANTAPEWLVKAGEATESFTSERCYIRELLNDAKSPEASLAHTRVASGVTTQLHSLTATVEVYVVLRGRGRVEIDGLEQDIASGDQVVIPAGAAQRITNTGNDDLCFYCVCTPRFEPGCYVNLEN